VLAHSLWALEGDLECSLRPGWPPGLVWEFGRHPPVVGPVERTGTPVFPTPHRLCQDRGFLTRRPPGSLRRDRFDDQVVGRREWAPRARASRTHGSDLVSGLLSGWPLDFVGQF